MKQMYFKYILYIYFLLGSENGYFAFNNIEKHMSVLAFSVLNTFFLKAELFNFSVTF